MQGFHSCANVDLLCKSNIWSIGMEKSTNEKVSHQAPGTGVAGLFAGFGNHPRYMANAHPSEVWCSAYSQPIQGFRLLDHTHSCFGTLARLEI